ncbi:NUDIX domain-containing protein [Patescibacteria group bacterium]|nr:NUDIX domain-containing protein [Patescibacteria group bacterium]
MNKIDISKFTTFHNSAGGVVINPNGQIAVVQMDSRDWSFPKGHVDKGETTIQAAKREIYEETGIKYLKLIKEYPTYQRPDGSNPKELKTINLFLFSTKETELKPQESDIVQAIWVEKDKVIETLSHQGDKDFFNSIKNEI